MHKVLLYQKLANNKVKCQTCAHYCQISPGKRGICGVRENQNGTLYVLNYGKIIAANIDPIEKKPLYHFLSGTQTYSIACPGCNFRCEFCQNWQISQITKGKNAQVVGLEQTPVEIVQQALVNRCPSISYTYTEPTIFFEFAYDTARLARKKGLANIFVTNGYETPETISKMEGLIDAANVDLKSFSEEFYQKICGAKLENVLKAIELMHTAGIFLEITTLIVPGQNDSEEELVKIAKFIANLDKNIPWHISRFHPQYKMGSFSPTSLATLEKAAQIGQELGLKHVHLGNI